MGTEAPPQHERHHQQDLSDEEKDRGRVVEQPGPGVHESDAERPPRLAVREDDEHRAGEFDEGERDDEPGQQTQTRRPETPRMFGQEKDFGSVGEAVDDSGGHRGPLRSSSGGAA